MKFKSKIIAISVAAMLIGGAIFAEEKPATKPTEAPKTATEKPAAEKKPAEKQSKRIRPTQSKDGY